MLPTSHMMTKHYLLYEKHNRKDIGKHNPEEGDGLMDAN